MIQLYARLSDLTECETTCAFEPEYLEARESIRRRGILKSIKIHPDGQIAYGNTRWFIARELGMKYVPIDLIYLLGLQYLPDTRAMQIRTSVLEFFEHGFNHPLDVLPAPYPPPQIDHTRIVRGINDISVADFNARLIMQEPNWDDPKDKLKIFAYDYTKSSPQQPHE